MENLGDGLTRKWSEIDKAWVYSFTFTCSTVVSEEATAHPRHVEWIKHKFANVVRAAGEKLDNG